MPAVRKILSDTAADGYPMQSIVLGIVKSYPFQFRRLDDRRLPTSAADR